MAAAVIALGSCTAHAAPVSRPLPAGTVPPTVRLTTQAETASSPSFNLEESEEAVTPKPVLQTEVQAPIAEQVVVQAAAQSSGVEQWRPLVAAYFPAWAVDEGLYVIRHESGGDPNIWNTTGSGACGLWQTLPCECIDPECNTAVALRKWKAAGESFYDPWLRWW